MIVKINFHNVTLLHLDQPSSITARPLEMFTANSLHAGQEWRVALYSVCSHRVTLVDTAMSRHRVQRWIKAEEYALSSLVSWR